MSATRLLVLGAIRIMQPVHGYEVRRELVSWRLEDTTNVKPGSIYGAMRTLEKDGCIAVHERAGGDRRPERTTYVLTAEGEKEFQLLLRDVVVDRDAAQGAADPRAVPDDAPPAGGARARAAGAHGVLEGQLDATLLPARRDQRRRHRRRRARSPSTCARSWTSPRRGSRAELDWSRGLQRRLRDGAYRFAGEDGFPELGPGRGGPC